MHLLCQIIYSCKTLYVFQTVFPSIIRSSTLRIQQWKCQTAAAVGDEMEFHLIPDSSR